MGSAPCDERRSGGVMARDDLSREEEGWDATRMTRIECLWYWDGEVGYERRKLGERWECRKIRVRK